MFETFVTVRRSSGRIARVLRAGFWTLGGGLGAYVLRIANSLIMTRLLVPEMFGVMALASIVQVIISLLSDFGVRQAVIQSPRGTEPDFLNTAWTLNLIRGCLIWLVCVGVAAALYLAQVSGWVGADTVYAAKELPLVIAATTFSSVLGGLRSTKWVIANRQLDMQKVTLIELLSQLLGMLVMIGIALNVQTIWALVIGGLVTSAISVTLTSTWLPGMSNRLRLDPESVRELIGYGRWVLISSICSVLADNGDRLLLGAWVAPSTLGFYVLAMNLNNIVISLSSKLFGTVGMPALSEVARDNPSGFPRAYRRMRVPFDIVCLGSAGMLFSLGHTLVEIMYDPRYAEAGEIVQILSFLMLFSRYGISTSAYLALGVPRYLTVISLVKLVSIYLIVPISYGLFGFSGAMWAIALHPLPTVPLIWWFNSRHRLHDIRYETLVMAWWLPGYLIGSGLVSAYEYVMR